MFNQKQYLIDNHEKISEQQKQYRLKNIEKLKKLEKQYYIEHREEILERTKIYRINNREKERERHKLYRIKNKEKLNENRKQHQINRRKTDLKFNLNCKMSTAIGRSLKNNKAGRHWETLVGYTLNDLIKRLKSTMPEDYTWNDFINGKLHIDHILPKVLFSIKEYKDCWNLYNLQLLSAKKNMIKNNSITNPILLGLLIKNERSIKSYAIQ